MLAVRCNGQQRGFRVEGVLWPSAYWTLVPEVSEAVRHERMLTVLEVTGSDDPQLAPFPVSDGKRMFTNEDRATVLQQQIEVLRGVIAEQAREISALQAGVLSETVSPASSGG